MRLAFGFVLLGLALSALAQSQSVNVCSPTFQCFGDVDCQSVGERIEERWACKGGRCLRVECIIDLECAKDLACLDNVCKAPRTSSIGGPCDITAGLRCPSGSQCDLRSKTCKESTSAENAQCNYQMFPPCGNGLTCLPFDDGILRCVNPSKTVRGLGDSCSENPDAAPPPTMCAIGLSCVNHKCSPTKVPKVGSAQCDDSCKSHAECETGVCLGVGYLKRGEVCSDGVQCESGQCKSGKCAGEDCSSKKCKETEVCISVPGGQPMCLTDPGSCLPDEVWLEGVCVTPPQLGQRCDPLTAPCPTGQYCDPRNSGCVQSLTLNQPCGWNYNAQARQLQSNCTAQAGELCFCEGPVPTCRRLSEPKAKPQPQPQPPPPPSLKRLIASTSQAQPLDNKLKDINIGQGCKGILQDPYSLLCVKELESPGRLQSPLLSFAFAIDHESNKEKACRDFWAKWSCCNICLQSALDEVADLDSTDLVARGLPGLSCSVEKVSLTPQVGTSNGDCVIGPSVSLQSRAWYRSNYCSSDFLAKFVDKNPYAFVQGSSEGDSPQAHNTTRKPLGNGAEGRSEPSPVLLATMVILAFLVTG